MHNLVLLKDIPGQALPDGCQVQACCIDSASRHLYVLTNTLDLICYHLESTKTLFSQSLLSVSGQDEEGGDFLQPDDRVISLQYVSELESVAMVCAGGSLMTVHVASRQLDVVGCMTGAIGAAAWSPDQVCPCSLQISSHALLKFHEPVSKLSGGACFGNGVC